MKTFESIIGLACLLFLVCLPLSLSGNNRFRQLAVNEGLAHTDATCIVQDSIGLIWIGTYAGLQSYDGYALQRYDYYPPGQKVYRAHNRIRALACTKDFLWVGTESGLACFDLETCRYVPYEMIGDVQDVQEGEIIRLCLNAVTGEMLLKTESRTLLAKVRGNSIEILPWNSDEDRIRCKALWTFETYGKSLWGRNGWEILRLGEREGKAAVLDVCSASSVLNRGDVIREFCFQTSHLYVRGEKGCYRLKMDGEVPDFSSVSFMEWPQEEYARSVNSSFVVTPSGDLWIGGNRGLAVISHPFSEIPVVRRYMEGTASDVSSVLRISGFLIDSADNLWMATMSRGVFYCSLSNTFLQTVSGEEFLKKGLSQNEVVSVCEHLDGTVWMLVEYSNLFRYVPRTGSLDRIPLDNTGNALLQALCLDATGNHLFIGSSRGVFVYTLASRRVEPLFTGREADWGLMNTSVAYLAVDDWDRLWVATWGNGVFCVDSPAVSPSVCIHLNRQTDPALLSDRISSLHLERETAFLCTISGLNRIRLGEHGQVKHVSAYQADVNLPTSMSTDYLAGIDCENDSVCWVGTIGGGLNRLTLHSDRDNDYTAEVYTMRDGLPGNDCEIVLIDRMGKVWVGGTEISCLSPSDRHIEVYGGDAESKAFKICSYAKGRDGMLYMGGLYGLTFFNPDLEQKTDVDCCNLVFAGLEVDNRFVFPGVVYEGRRILDRSVDRSRKINLSYCQRSFSIAFAALNRNVSTRCMYRYRLLGLDKEWKQLPFGENKAYFFNLPYGSYRLEVQYSLDKGTRWHEPARTLGIDMLPPWWWTNWMKMVYLLLLAGGAAYAFVHYMREQKLRRENEIQKILLEQDEEKYQAKIQFFMNASHELKTPLTLIQLAAEKLVMENRLSRECNVILHQTRRMFALISELVDFRKTDLGISALTLERVNLSQMVRKIFSDLTPWVEDKRIVVTCQVEEQIVLDADADKLGKLIVNLLSNAVKYTGWEGHIDVSLRRGMLHEVLPSYPVAHTEGKMDERQEACLLIVRDTGIGISADSIRKIYERFFQVRGASDSHLGSGIGLAIVKNIVLQHGGVIMVSSERGKGTEFIVVLPIYNKCIEKVGQSANFDLASFIQDNYHELPDLGETQNDEVIAESEDSSSPMLLIVEDNRELREVLKEYFVSTYRVQVAANGLEGLEKCLSMYPDVIVSDVMMPEMDGIEMCRRIKNNLSVAYIPLVMLTAKSNVESQIDGYESGADLYLSKPFSLKLLDVNLRRLLKQRERWMRGENLPKWKSSVSELPEPEKEVKTEVTTNVGGRERDRLVEKLKEIIASCISDTDLSPDHLASEVGVSRSKLYQRVGRIDGQSLADYVRNCRLEKAAGLLVSTDLTVQEIMVEVGLTNASHFSKIFKMRYGVSPYEYRLKHS